MSTSYADLLSKVWELDLGSINSTLHEALKNGQATISDGVAYWAKGSGRTGIIQHLKFVERTVNKTDEILRQLQSATAVMQNIQQMQNLLMATQVISSVAIVGAIVVQTQYLGRKLDAIQSTVDEIAATQHEQNLIFYMDKIGDYMGSVEYARVLLQDRSVANVIGDVASPLLADLGSKRGHIVSLVDNIAGYVQACSRERAGSEHFKLMIDFIHLFIDILPGALHTEYLLAARIGKPQLAEIILDAGSRRYEQVLGNYKKFMNKLYKEAVSGVLTAGGDKVLMEYKPKLAELLDSPLNQLLLYRPPVKIAA